MKTLGAVCLSFSLVRHCGARDEGESYGGGDGLVHIYKDGKSNREFARVAKQRGAFVIPTLAVIEPLLGLAGGESLASDTRRTPYIRQDQLENLRKCWPKERLASTESYVVAEETVRLLKEEGVTILAGSY